MSRSIYHFPYGNNNISKVIEIFETHMQQENFTEKIVNGERLWIKGDGVILLMQCFKIILGKDSFTVEAWVKDAVMGESDLSGFAGKLPKSRMKKIIEKIKIALW